MANNRPGNSGQKCAAGLSAAMGYSANVSVVIHFADVLLRVEFDADLLDEVDLGFEEVDMALLVLHQAFEDVAGDVVLHGVAVGRRLLVERARRIFRLEIASPRRHSGRYARDRAPACSESRQGR